MTFDGTMIYVLNYTSWTRVNLQTCFILFGYIKVMWHKKKAESFYLRILLHQYTSSEITKEEKQNQTVLVLLMSRTACMYNKIWIPMLTVNVFLAELLFSCRNTKNVNWTQLHLGYEHWIFMTGSMKILCPICLPGPDASSFSGRQLHLDNKPPLEPIHNLTIEWRHINVSLLSSHLGF